VSEDARNRTIAVYAPSKTFNLAGLVGAYHIIYSKYLRDRVRAQSSKSHYNNVNVFSIHALIGAYKQEGYEWVDELVQVIGENVDYASEYILKNYKGIKFAKPQGTYMLYLDCEEYCKEHNMTLEQLYKAGTDVGVMWQDGRPFNRPYAIRLNLALPKSKVIEAFERLDKHVFNV
jgi:cystathionine beta-lyase